MKKHSLYQISTTAVAIAMLAALSCLTSASAASHEQGRLQEVGKITKADAQTGWVEMEMVSLGGRIALHFTPSDVTDVRPGDRVAVDIYLMQMRPHADAGRDLGDPSWRSHQTTETEITSINRKTGIVHGKTPDGLLSVQFLPDDMPTLKVGDHVTIAYSFKPCPARGQCLRGGHR